MKLKNKNIIITGAGEGIGKELALKLSLHNNIILIGRNIKKIEDLKNKLNPNNHLTIQCDIAVKEDLEKAYNEIVNNYKSIDILINNAGISSAKKFNEYTDEEIEKVLDINIKGTILITKKFIEDLKKSKGAIVNIGSMFGEIAHPCYTIYSSSKFAIKGFSDALRRELNHFKVKVFYVSPRATKTQSLQQTDDIGKFFKMNVDEPEKVAKYIIKGINNNQFTIYPKSIERFFLFIQKFFTKLIDNNLSAISKKIYLK